MFFQIKISFFFVLFVYVSSQHSIQTDKDALLEFKKSIKIDPNSVLSNWNESNEVCSFRGIYCRNGYRVRRIELVGFGLVGPLPSSISNLTALRTIDLSGNKFYGKIPEGISSLIHFRYLLLESNNLEGRIPESLSSLSNLTILSLKDNKLQGDIPPSLFSNCTVLSNLDLSHNFLSGKIPENIGNCPNLWTLNLYNNRFIGEIPFSLSNASDMYNLDVESNYLSGELPSKLVSKLTKLLYLHLSYNYMVSHDQNNNLDVFFTALTNCSMLQELELAGMGLGGTLPDSVGQLGVNFSQMLLQENKIYGSVPSGFANLSNLMWLNLTMNHMNGTIAPELKKLPLLEQLLLSHNAFTGEIPEEIGECVHLGRLELSYNNFSGEIPSSLGKCVGLADVDLSHNRFNGHIPPDNKLSGPLTNLPNGATYSSPYPSYLFLQDNSFNESIPMSLCKRSDLVYLDFSNNRLTGNLPECLENLQQLQILMLSSNQLSGVIPSFKGLISLGELNLRDNNFVGTLPRELVNLPSLNILDVGENELSGNIPGWIGERPEYLVVLRLHKNNFTGRIPESLCKASHLHVLDVAHNNLKGHIPRCLGELNAMSNYDESMFKGFSLNNDEVLTQVMKGVYLEYKKTWDLVYNMDLSSNKLVGEIPVELTALSMLMGLNLSNNHLNGSIPNNIGNLRRKLESLDLSGNKLTGVIPPSMAYLTFLSHLNLSHNNLSGRIPTGRQLQTLTDPSIYEGNKYLCGPPLSDNCSNPEDPTTTPTTSKKKHKGVDVLNNLWLFYLDVISGFATGFWGVIGVLVLKKQWRHNLFRSAEEIFDKIKRRREAE